MAATRVYGGVSADERVEVRRPRLLDAAPGLVGPGGWRGAAALRRRGAGGWAGTGGGAICREAGLTPRFFYESFDDLDALAVAVFDDISIRATAAILEAVRDAAAGPAPRGPPAI